jgi:aspartokinase
MNAIDALPVYSAFEPAHSSREVSLITIERAGMAILPDLPGKVLLVLAQAKIDVLFTSQASCQGNLCVVVARRDLCDALDVLRLALQHELDDHTVLRLAARNDVVLLAAGNGRTPARNRLYESLAHQGINILATTQALGAANISAVVEVVRFAQPGF